MFTVRTPELCDRFRRFDFEDFKALTSSAAAAGLAPVSPGLIVPPNPLVSRPGSGGERSSKVKSMSASSPPLSPAKKKDKESEKAKRPMNGFMLFAKKYRIELIQKHPGKDNR